MGNGARVVVSLHKSELYKPVIKVVSLELPMHVRMLMAGVTDTAR